MSNFPTLTPYVIEDIISNDNFYTHYKAIGTHVEENLSFIVTEFNPSFMVKRMEDGVLEPTDRFIMEYEMALERFTKMGETFSSLGEAFIAPIEEVLTLNNTVYVVRCSSGRNKSLDEGLKDGKMEFTEAYTFLRPLIQSLAAAWKKGLFFQFQLDNIRVTSYGQLILDSMFDWDPDHQQTIVGIGELFYRLITGVPHDPSIAENPTVEGMGLPPRLTAALKDILTGDPAYGSIDDFNKQLRSIMDAEGKKEIEKPSKTVVRPKREPGTLKKGVALGLIAGVAILAAILAGAPILRIFVFRGGGGGVEYYYTVYDAYRLEEPTASPTPDVFVRRHTAYAVTDPRDPSIMLNGSFHRSGDILYYRTYREGYGLSRRNPDGTVTELVRGVRPAFITSMGNYIYFSDGLSGYNIRRIRTDGNGLETISDGMASFLLPYGGSLFYTDHNNRDFLNRLDLNTLVSQPFLRTNAYTGFIDGGLLYFVDGRRGFRIYAVPLTHRDGESQALQINDANSDNLRLAMGDIFYRDVETGFIHRVGIEEPIVPLPAASFDIYGYIVAIIEAGTQELWLYDLDTGDFSPTGIFGAYAAAGPGVVDLIDFSDTRINRQFVSPLIAGEEDQGEDEDENEYSIQE